MDSSIVQGPFSVAPCQTLVSRFATFSSLYPTGGCTRTTATSRSHLGDPALASASAVEAVEGGYKRHKEAFEGAPAPAHRPPPPMRNAGYLPLHLNHREPTHLAPASAASVVVAAAATCPSTSAAAAAPPPPTAAAAPCMDMERCSCHSRADCAKYVRFSRYGFKIPKQLGLGFNKTNQQLLLSISEEKTYLINISI